MTAALVPAPLATEYVVTFTQLVQLYAPLAGLLVVTFWLGVLSARVMTLEREERARKQRDRDDQSDHDSIVRMEAHIETLTKGQEAMQRELAGVHRALAHMASGKGGAIVQFGGGGEG